MERGTLIILLALMTLLAGLAVGFWQMFSVNRAKQRNSHSAFTDPNTGTHPAGRADSAPKT